MLDYSYRLKPQAVAALEARKAELLRYRKLRLVTSAYVRAQVAEFERDLYRNALEEVAENARVGVRCPGCGFEAIMPEDVTHWKCHKCSPHQERPTGTSRFALV